MPAHGKRVALSEQALEDALVSGMTHAQIAEQFRCSERTVRNRLAAARKKHGVGWPVPRRQATPPPPRPAFKGDDVTREELERLARIRLAQVIKHGEEQNATTAAKAVLLSPVADSGRATQVDAQALRERLRARAKGLGASGASSKTPAKLKVVGE